LEERQRAEARERKEKGVSWETKVCFVVKIFSFEPWPYTAAYLPAKIALETANTSVHANNLVRQSVL